MKTIWNVIVTYNPDSQLTELLKSLNADIRRKKDFLIKTVIVDNASSTGFPDSMPKEFRPDKIIRQKTNKGFAAGVNVGIRYALENKADSVILINQDTYAKAGFYCYMCMNNSPIVAPVISFRRNGKITYDYGGKVYLPLGKTYHLETTDTAIPRNAETIDYVSGCCIKIDRRVFETIGFFDERYFLYYEDVDFCLRASDKGFRPAVEYKAEISHNLKEGKGKSAFQRKTLVLSYQRFIGKWVPWYFQPFAYIRLAYLALHFI